jgi:hypothetical protein
MKVVSSLLIEKRATQMERALSRKRTPQRNARAASVRQASLRRRESVM